MNIFLVYICLLISHIARYAPSSKTNLSSKIYPYFITTYFLGITYYCCCIGKGLSFPLR